MQVRKVKVEKKINEIVNRLNKTKEEKFPDLQEERQSRDRAEREDMKRKLQDQKQREKEEEKKRVVEAEIRYVWCCTQKARRRCRNTVCLVL